MIKFTFTYLENTNWLYRVQVQIYVHMYVCFDYLTQTKLYF